MPRVTRRQLVALLLIIAGLTALAIPFLFYGPARSGTGTSPPPGGETTPPSTRNGGGSPPGGGSGGGSQDMSSPRTSITITGPFYTPKDDDKCPHPRFAVILHATDDVNLSVIILNDTGTVHMWNVSGTFANATWTLTSPGLHQLAYRSVDKAGNKETPHTISLDIVNRECDRHIDRDDSQELTMPTTRTRQKQTSDMT